MIAHRSHWGLRLGINGILRNSEKTEGACVGCVVLVGVYAGWFLVLQWMSEQAQWYDEIKKTHRQNGIRGRAHPGPRLGLIGGEFQMEIACEVSSPVVTESYGMV